MQNLKACSNCQNCINWGAGWYYCRKQRRNVPSQHIFLENKCGYWYPVPFREISGSWRMGQIETLRKALPKVGLDMLKQGKEWLARQSKI